MVTVQVLAGTGDYWTTGEKGKLLEKRENLLQLESVIRIWLAVLMRRIMEFGDSQVEVEEEYEEEEEYEASRERRRKRRSSEEK